MNSVNNMVEEVLETSRRYFAQLDGREEPGRRHPGVSVRTQDPVYSLLTGAQSRGSVDVAPFFDTHPQGIRELTSPLSD